MVDGDGVGHEGGYGFGALAHENDRRGIAAIGPDHVDESVDAGHLSHDDARLHGLGRGAAEQRFGDPKFHGGQLGGSAGQRLGAELHARGDDTAAEGARLVQKFEGGGGAQVDDEGRRAVGALGAHHLGDAVGAHGRGIGEVHLQPRLKTWAYGERARVREAPRRIGPHAGEGRDDRGDDGPVGQRCAFGKLDSARCFRLDGRQPAGEGVEEAEDAGHGAVGRLVGIGGDGPLGDEPSVKRQPDSRPRVPYVDRQNQRHNRSSFHLFRSCTFRQ